MLNQPIACLSCALAHWQPNLAAVAHHMLGVQEVQAARDVQRNAAAAAPPA